MTLLAPCAKVMLAVLNRHISSLPARDGLTESPQGPSPCLLRYLSVFALSQLVLFQGLLASQDKV